MKSYRILQLVVFVIITPILAGCVSTPQKDYSRFRAEDPRSILVLPVVNRTVNVDAPDYFLTTISRPVAERGFYVFPINLTKRVLEDDGLSDANLVHSADPTRLGEIFGADAILYISIERWEAKYAIITTTVVVEFTYILKSGLTGEELWRETSTMKYSPSQSNSGFLLADLIVNATTAAMTKAAPNYIPLAQQANLQAVGIQGVGFPAGPYREEYGEDLDYYPVLNAETSGEVKPAAAEPIVAEPVVVEPVVVEPVVVEPVVAEPVVAEPVVAEPAFVEPAVVEPAVVEPAVVEPAVVESVVVESVVVESAVVEEESSTEKLRKELNERIERLRNKD